jgi:hypothetical protein
MNAIQEISLKLQLGIDPDSEVNPQDLRTMWRQASDRKYGSEWKAQRDRPCLYQTARQATQRRAR